MEREPLPPTLDMPSFRLRFKSWERAIGVVGGILGVLVFLVPALTEAQELPRLRWTLSILLVLAATASPVYPWLVEVGRVVFRRTRTYPALRRRVEQESTALHDLQRGVLDLVSVMAALGGYEGEDDSSLNPGVNRAIFSLGLNALASHVFEISRASLDQGKIVIAVRKSLRAALYQDDMLVVVDTEDGLVMGTFTVTEERAEEYYAVGGDDVDRVWLGSMMERIETSMLPNKVAILTTQGENR